MINEFYFVLELLLCMLRYISIILRIKVSNIQQLKDKKLRYNNFLYFKMILFSYVFPFIHHYFKINIHLTLPFYIKFGKLISVSMIGIKTIIKCPGKNL